MICNIEELLLLTKNNIQGLLAPGMLRLHLATQHGEGQEIKYLTFSLLPYQLPSQPPSRSNQLFPIQSPFLKCHCHCKLVSSTWQLHPSLSIEQELNTSFEGLASITFKELKIEVDRTEAKYIVKGMFLLNFRCLLPCWVGKAQCFLLLHGNLPSKEFL